MIPAPTTATNIESSVNQWGGALVGAEFTGKEGLRLDCTFRLLCLEPLEGQCSRTASRASSVETERVALRKAMTALAERLWLWFHAEHLQPRLDQRDVHHPVSDLRL